MKSKKQTTERKRPTSGLVKSLVGSALLIGGCAKPYAEGRLGQMEYETFPNQTSYALAVGSPLAVNTDLAIEANIGYTRMDDQPVHADNFEGMLALTYPFAKLGHFWDVRVRLGAGTNRANVQLPNGNDGVSDTTYYNAGLSTTVNLKKLRLSLGVDLKQYDSEVQPKSATNTWLAAGYTF